MMAARKATNKKNPRGKHLSGATAKQQRQYEHIKAAERKAGRPLKEAKRIAAATVRAGSKKRGTAKRRVNPDHFIVNYMVGKQYWKIGIPDASKPRGYAYLDGEYATREAAIRAGKKMGLKLRGPAKLKKLAPRRRNKTIIKARTIKHLDVSKVHNPYQDLVIKGTATKTPQGWKVGRKTIPQGKGIVNVSSGYKLDKATGIIFAKRARNIAQGFYDGNGVFHPIRASADYVPAFAGEGRDIIDVHRKKKPAKKAASKTRSRRNVAQGFFDGNGVFHPIRSAGDYDDNRVGVHTRSKKRKAAAKRASQTAKSHAESKRRKATTSRLASRSLSRSYSLPAGSKSRKRNPQYTVEAIPKYTSTVKKDVKALTRGSAIRKVQREVEGPKNAYRYRVEKNPRRTARRNPSPADNRREFAGHYTGDKKLRFPDGTPSGLSKLGTLKLIKTEAGTLKPSQGTAWLCRDQKGKLHIGTTRLDGVVYGGDAGSFGKVELIEYDETKKHLYPNSGRIRFYHKMGEEDGKQPVLYSDGKGGLKFKGGNYRIESRGIVN